MLFIIFCFTIKKKIMEDREKVLRWNLQEAQKEMGKPTDIGGMLIASVSFGIIKNREENLRKAQQELDDYIKTSNIEIMKRLWNRRRKAFAIHIVSKHYMVLKYDGSLEKYVQYSRELGYYEAQKFYNDSVNILKHQVIMCQIHNVKP